MTPGTPQFADLLSRALTEPGVVSRAYSAFYGYSVGNQLLAFVQCNEREIPPGPIATFMGWKEKGRCVRKGEKAIMLCMPITAKRKAAEQPAIDASDEGQPYGIVEEGMFHLLFPKTHPYYADVMGSHADIQAA